MGDMGPQCFLCCLAEVEHLLFYAVCLGRLPFLGPLAERTGFLLGLFPSAYTGIFGLPGTPEPSLGYEAKEKLKELTPVIYFFIFWILKSQPVRLLSTFQSSYIYLFYM